MRVTVLQLSPGQDKGANIDQARTAIAAAAHADRPGLIALPEVWTCLGGTRETKVAQSEVLPAFGSASTGGPAYEALRAAARRHRLYLHGGSLIEQSAGPGGARLFNTSVSFAPDGTEVARYRKLHLFDVSTPDGTGYCESATFGSGDQIVTYWAHDLPVGCAICYDLRFAELFQALRTAGAELILVPSAFTSQTGRAHWEPLLRARAIETQCWVAAPATVGEHLDATGATRLTWGHAMICNPWGDVVAQTCAGRGISWATADINRAFTAKLRRDMPVLEHRRLPAIVASRSIAGVV